MRNACLLVCAVLFAGTGAYAQSLSGTFTMQTANGTFTLVMQENGSQLSGRLTGATGHTMELQGEVDAGVGMGVIRDNQGGLFFETFFEGNDLVLMLIEPDASNMPDYNKMRELVFQRSRGSTPVAKPAAPPPVSGGISGGTSSGGTNPLARKSTADPFVGTFSGEGVTLTLSGEPGDYSGTLVFGGTRYPVTASGSRLTGSFSANGGNFPFSATVTGNSMTFETGGTRYSLTKQGTAPAKPAPPDNPLQKRGNTTTAPGRTPKGYSGGDSTISDEQAGVSLTVPSGWKARKQQAGGYVLASDTHRGLILITGHSYNSVQQMEQDSGEGIQDPQNNTSLMFTGQSVPVGNNGLGCEMTGSVQGTPARAYTVGLVSPYGGGILIIALTSSEAYSGQYRQWAEQMAAGTRFSEPRLDTALMQWFAGKYWRYSSSSSYTSVYATESSMTFCANGLYHDSYESGGSGTGSDQYGNQNMSYGAVGSQQGRARWVIRGNKQQGVITVIKPDGSSYDMEYRAVGEGQDMVFDGTRYNWVNRGDCN